MSSENVPGADNQQGRLEVAFQDHLTQRRNSLQGVQNYAFDVWIKSLQIPNLYGADKAAVLFADADARLKELELIEKLITENI